MRTKLFSTFLLLGLGGCSHSVSMAPQEPAGPWVDARIEQSAVSISLAQTRLHQTSAARPFTPVSTPVPLPMNVQRPAVEPLAESLPKAGG